MQASKMKFSHFMGLYTARSLKCLDAVVYLPVIVVYSENEVLLEVLGQCSLLITCQSFRGSVVELE
jgi:hypothetical protein